MQIYSAENEIFFIYLSRTLCPGSSDPFYIVTYYIKWVTISWTHSRLKGIPQDKMIRNHFNSALCGNAKRSCF